MRVVHLQHGTGETKRMDPGGFVTVQFSVNRFPIIVHKDTLHPYTGPLQEIEGESVATIQARAYKRSSVGRRYGY